MSNLNTKFIDLKLDDWRSNAAGIEFTPMQESSSWTMNVADINFTPRKGYEPNAFHRLMQRLILGIRWEPTKE